MWKKELFFKKRNRLFVHRSRHEGLKKKIKIFVFASFAFQVRLLNSCKMWLRYILGVRADSHLLELEIAAFPSSHTDNTAQLIPHAASHVSYNECVRLLLQGKKKIPRRVRCRLGLIMAYNVGASGDY